MPANVRVPSSQRPSTLKINTLAVTQKTKVLTATRGLVETRGLYSLVILCLRETNGRHEEAAFTQWPEELFPGVWSVLWSQIKFESRYNEAVLQRAMCVWVCVCVRQNTLERECVETVSSSQSKWSISETLRIASIWERAWGRWLLRSAEWPLRGAESPLKDQWDLWPMSPLFLRDLRH